MPGLYAQADKTAIAVSNVLARPDLPPAVREELHDLSVQLLHMRIRFTACGFFPLDFSQLHAVIAAITTYLIILLQTQTPQSVLDSLTAKAAAMEALSVFENYTSASFGCGRCGCCKACNNFGITAG